MDFDDVGIEAKARMEMTGNPRPVLCLNTGEVWKSPTEAQRNGQGDVIKAVRLERMAGGMVWKIAEESLAQEYWSAVEREGTFGPFKLANPDDYEEEIFIISAMRSQVHSQQDVARANSVRMKRLWLEKGISMRWEARQRSDQLKEILSDPEIRAKMSAAKNRFKKAVMNTETGNVYESSWEASRQTGVRQSRISNECCGRRTGPWKYADTVAQVAKKIDPCIVTDGNKLVTEKDIELDPVYSETPYIVSEKAEASLTTDDSGELTSWVTTVKGKIAFPSAKIAKQKGYGDVKKAIAFGVFSGGYKWRYMTVTEVAHRERTGADGPFQLPTP